MSSSYNRRSTHHAAKWVCSPHELAETYAGWRCFRHLTYAGIRSYLLGETGFGGRSGLSCSFGKHYTAHFHMNDLDRFHETTKDLRREGSLLSVKVRRTPAHPIADPLMRVPPYYVRALSAWEEIPTESEYRNKIAVRLGTSCVLCGLVQRGLDALTEGQRAVEWLGFDWLPESRTPLTDRCFRNGHPKKLYPNPLCPECWSKHGEQRRPIHKIVMAAAVKAARLGTLPERRTA